MFRCSKLVSLPKNLQISVRSILQHELRPLLNFKILPNNRFGSNMLTSTLVRNCSSMFSHGNTDLKIDQDSSWYYVIFMNFINEINLLILLCISFQFRFSSLRKSQRRNVGKFCRCVRHSVGRIVPA